MCIEMMAAVHRLMNEAQRVKVPIFINPIQFPNIQRKMLLGCQMYIDQVDNGTSNPLWRTTLGSSYSVATGFNESLEKLEERLETLRRAQVAGAFRLESMVTP